MPDTDSTEKVESDSTVLLSHTGVPLTRKVAFRFTLDPTPEQERALFSHAGAARYAFNHQLARVYANMNQRTAEKSYGIPKEQLTPALSWSKMSLINHVNQWKDGRAPDAPVSVLDDGTVVRGLPWRSEVSACVFETASASVAQALANWIASLEGEREGPKIEPPKFKKKSKTTPKFRLRAHYTEGTPSPVRPTRPRAMRFPKLGEIRIRENTRKLRRMLESGRLHVHAAAFTYQARRWTVSVIGVAADFHHLRSSTVSRPVEPVGVDLGVKTLAVAANTEGLVLHEWQGVKALQRAQTRLRLADKALSRTKIGSAGHRKARARLGKVHARVRHLREALLHEITTALATEYRTVVIEDLNVVGMLQLRSLARHVADAAFGELRRQLEYKADWYGTKLVVADRWFPSSKTCSGCGRVEHELTLSDRTYHCARCGLSIDRNVNAAINLARWTPDEEQETWPPLLATA